MNSNDADFSAALHLLSISSDHHGSPTLAVKDVSGTPFPGAGWSPILSSGTSLSTSGMDVNPLSALQLATAHACIDRIASDIAKLRLRMMHRATRGQYTPVDEHGLVSLIERPNRRQTAFEMMYSIVFGYLVQGNGYAPVIYGSNGVPQAVIGLPLGRCTVQEMTDGSLTYRANSTLFAGYKTSAGSQRNRIRTITEEEMIHLRRMSLDGVRGTSVLNTAADVFGLGLSAQTLAGKTFKNGAHFQFVLTTPNRLSPQAADDTQNDFIKRLSGVANAGRPPVLHSGFEINKVSMSPVEAQLLEARADNAADICRLFGVPMALLGIGSGNSGASMTYKNLAQDMEAYVSSTLMNIIEPLQDLFSTRLLFDPDGRPVPTGGAVRGEYKFEFDTNLLTRPDRATRFATHQVAVRSHIQTPNEVRAMEGLAPIPGGEVFPDMKDAPEAAPKTESEA